MRFTLTIIALSVALTGFMPAFVSAEENYATAMIKAPEKEVHGVWLAYEDYGKLGLTVLDGEEAYREAAENFLSDMDTCGINTVFLHERAFDDAFWKSPTFHASRYLGGDESLTAAEAYPFDPAGIFLEEAHERGISVHAWLNPYRVSRSYYYDPAEDASTERVLTAVRELMEFESGGETFDGIHLDDYFYHADWNDELTEEEIIKLVDFLITEVESDMDTKFVKELSNYEILCCNWDLIYSDGCYETIGYMPNYLEM